MPAPSPKAQRDAVLLAVLGALTADEDANGYPTAECKKHARAVVKIAGDEEKMAELLSGGEARGWGSKALNPDQPRDEHGRFGSGGGTKENDMDNLRSIATEALDKRDDWQDAVEALAEAGVPDANREVVTYLTEHTEDNPPNDSLPDESRPELNLTEQAAVYNYTGDGYDEINEALKSGSRVSRVAPELQAAILKAGKFPEPVVGARGMEIDDDDDFDAFAESLQSSLESGEPITFKEFTSTSTGQSFPGNVQLEIRAIQGLDTQPYGKGSGELLLPAGSDFKVVSVKRTGGKVRAVLEQLPYE